MRTNRCNVRENINELNDNEVGCLAIRFVGKDILTRDQIKRGVVLLSDDNLVKNVRRKFKAITGKILKIKVPGTSKLHYSPGIPVRLNAKKEQMKWKTKY